TMWMALALVAALLGPDAGRPARGQGDDGGRAAEGGVPPDAAVLELDLPSGAEAFIDGNPQGASRRIRFRPFPARAMGRYEVKVRLRDGRELAARTVLLQRGWLARLPLSAATVDRPKLVIQTGHSRPVDFRGDQRRRSADRHRVVGQDGDRLG